MDALRIHQIIYKGDLYRFESPIFVDNLVLVEGDNGTGKTTFCNLIYFALGGKVKEFSIDSDRKHKEITSDSNNFVELYIALSGKNFKIRRLLNDNDIAVSECNPIFEGGLLVGFTVEPDITLTQIFPINRSANAKYIFSDWILERLGISVVDLYHGYTTFKVNFTELARLMYHDQQPNPELIYKQLDTKSNYINDSELLRKAIFELLIGKSFSDFYDSIAEAKDAEKSKLLARSLLNEYTLLADQLRGKGEVKNRSFLAAEIESHERQLEFLHNARNAFKRNRTNDASVETAISTVKNSLLDNELAMSSYKDRLVNLFDEKNQLIRVKSTTVSEIGQINKIIHSHDQLNLFSADTCPYCLSKVTRAAGHCVCGSEIDEKQYERFFYTSQEYKDIFKAKTKTLKTIEEAIAGCDSEIIGVRVEFRVIEERAQQFREKLRGMIGRLDEQIDIESLNDIDDKILDTRESIALLTQRIETETKLERLNADYEQKRLAHQNAELRMRGFENAVKIEISDKVGKFSIIYNRLMTATLKDCRAARISLDNYLPIINDGEYKEASSGVSIRLMYYLAMMELSLANDDVPFPRFLLIDTPETAGIELDNLKNCIAQLEQFERFGKDYQVILTTGLDKYPDSFKKHRVIFMPTKQQALLEQY
jgi:hypothetical protein